MTAARRASRTIAASATPSAPAAAADRTSPTAPEIPAVQPSSRSPRAREPNATTARATTSAAPESAARSWMPTNDGSRCSGRFPSNSATIPGELQQRPRGGRGAPGGDRPEQRQRVLAAPKQQDESGREQRVLAELGGGDRVGAGSGSALPRAADRASRRRRGRGRRPRRATSSERHAAAPNRRHGRRGRREHDGEHDEIRELDPDRGRARADARRGLIAQVQEEDGNRERRHERRATPCRATTRPGRAASGVVPALDDGRAGSSHANGVADGARASRADDARLQQRVAPRGASATSDTSCGARR